MPATRISFVTVLRTALCTAATLWVTRTAPTAAPWRTTGTAVARMLSPMTVARALDLDGAAVERRRDLRPARVALPGGGRRRAVGEHQARCVEDQHATPHGRGAGVCERFKALRVRRADQVRRGGGDHVSLAECLRAHLRVDAVSKAQGERHPQRDDRQDEHIGEREQQASPQADGSDLRVTGVAKAHSPHCVDVPPASRAAPRAFAAAPPCGRRASWSIRTS